MLRLASKLYQIVNNQEKYVSNKNGHGNGMNKQQKSEKIIENRESDQITQHTEKNDCIWFLGKISYVEPTDQLFKIKRDDGKEESICCKEIDWKATVGDAVKVVKRNSSDETVLEYKIYPRKKYYEYNRVTGLGNGYAIFDNNKILWYDLVKEVPSLRIYEEYKVQVIESEQNNGLSTFNCRIINLLEKQEKSVIGNGIIFENKPFRIFLNDEDDEKKNETRTKHICIYNRSEKAPVLKCLKVIPFDPENEKLIKFDKSNVQLNFTMRPKTGRFTVYFNVCPKKIGKFYFYLIANFGKFQEKHEFSVEIFKSYIIPGEKCFKGPRFVDVQISEYGIPNDLREIDYSNFFSAIEEMENVYPSLKEPLTPLNYHERMKLCVYLEELGMEKSFEAYHIERGTFETVDEYLKLTVNGVAERRPSIIIGDKITAKNISSDNSTEQTIFEGFIHKVGDDAVLCKFHTDFHENHENKEYLIDFVFSRSIFRRQHYALESFISNSELGYNFLFPNDKICKNDLQLDALVDSEGVLCIGGRKQNWFNNQLNQFQKNAIVNVLRGEKRPLPYIFFGCPGSGKTNTVVETILQIQKNVKSSKICIAAPSNSAANLILEMLINSHCLNNEEDGKVFLRIVSNNQVEKDLIPENLSKYCGTVNIASDSGGNSPSKDKRGILQHCTKSTIMKYQILIGTLNCLGNLMQMAFNGYFTHVIIDEAGQAIEPEIVIPLTMMKKSGQCIFAGDPKQLGAIVISSFANHYKFNTSMLERLLSTHWNYSEKHGPNNNEYDSKYVTKLKINYRSHPTVLSLYNDIFYNGTLESAVNDTDSLETLFLASMNDLLWEGVNKNCGVIFVNVNGVNKKIPESCSWYNDQEINGVMAFLNKCRTRGTPFKEIGILAPYALQVKKLKHQISFMNDTDLKVGTVEEFQGQERLVMILSTVRTENRHLNKDKFFGLGFLQCPKRINVAISRARALLVIFGKESILKKDPNWKRIIDYTKANNTFVAENY